MSISINVSLGFVSKKVTILKSATVAQLTQQSLDKFAQLGGGQLSYNNKVLDGSLPIRLTNLIPNCKVKLELVAGNSDPINVKLTINYLDQPAKTVVSKIEESSTLLELLQKFDEIHGLGLNYDAQTSMAILNLTYTDYSLKLSSVIGKTSSVVVRFNYLKNSAEGRLEQEEAVRAELHQQELRRQRERQQRLKEQETKELERKERAKQEQDNKQEEVETDTNKEAEVLYLKPEEQKEDPTTLTESILQRGQEPSYEYSDPQIDENPQLYVPEPAALQVYENPDEDYDMTLTQAQTYHKLIQNSAIRKKKSVASTPSKLLIRIKFPDRNILQINFVNDVEKVKFGQLVKKIDELLIESNVGNYSLKYGYPPFTKIDMSFDFNNKRLVEIPDFQNERIMLIWESTNSSVGPYTKEGAIAIKRSSELPEMVLESHRKDLPEEEQVALTTGKPQTEKKQEKNSKDLPKWFKSR